MKINDKNFSLNFTGIYQCQVVLSASSKVSSNTRLIVNIPPQITDNSTRSVITSVGSSIVLQCWATGKFMNRSKKFEIY